MLLRTPLQRTFRVYRRADGRFVTRSEHPADSPLGVDLSLNMALGTAHREAIAVSRDEGCVVVWKSSKPMENGNDTTSFNRPSIPEVCIRQPR